MSRCHRAGVLQKVSNMGELMRQATIVHKTKRKPVIVQGWKSGIAGGSYKAVEDTCLFICCFFFLNI